MRSPPGPLTLGKDPGLVSKVAGLRNILNQGVCFGGGLTRWPQAGTPKCYLVRGHHHRDWSCPEKARTGRMKAPMRDALIVVLFVAMVLTPAVIAARSGRDLYRDE